MRISSSPEGNLLRSRTHFWVSKFPLFQTLILNCDLPLCISVLQWRRIWIVGVNRWSKALWLLIEVTVLEENELCDESLRTILLLLLLKTSCGSPFGDPESDSPWMNSGNLLYFWIKCTKLKIVDLGWNTSGYRSCGRF